MMEGYHANFFNKLAFKYDYPIREINPTSNDQPYQTYVSAVPQDLVPGGFKQKPLIAAMTYNYLKLYDI
ncbi:MAG: hypothetical protein KKE59_03935 [Proteobacteria bacterium]|nr:hypothetical protein [Pseudomonadota bacterium]